MYEAYRSTRGVHLHTVSYVYHAYANFLGLCIRDIGTRWLEFFLVCTCDAVPRASFRQQAIEEKALL